MSFYIKAMKRQLIELGVMEEKIYHFYDLRSLVWPPGNSPRIQCYGIDENVLNDKMDGKIVLLSTDMDLGGTAMALFHMAKVLKEQGYPIVFASMMDGVLRESVLECGVPVVVDSNLQLAVMRETAWVSKARLIICNAVNYHIFLSDRDTRIPIIWWLHDSEFFYDGVSGDVFQRISIENLKTYSVGSVPREAVHKVLPNMSVGELLYGVDDTAEHEEKRKFCQEKVHFITIGYIEERKGQDILIEAVQRMRPDIREQAVFYLVGQDTSLMAQRIKKKTENMQEVILTGTVDREKIEKLLNIADVMICPSREDPMPTVAAEAMMHRVPCILSDAAGTAAYITDGKDGLVFSSGNVEELVEKITWCIEQRDRLAKMGKCARVIYKEKFSMDVFGKNVKKIVEDALKEC